MKAIIMREYFVLRHNLVSFICVWALLPMMVYLLISIPFSFYISLESGINYLNWSSIGNWILTSSVLSYILSMHLSLNYRLAENSSKSYLYSSLSNSNHILAMGIWASIMGFVQLIFSLLITLTLNSGNLFLTDILLIMIYILPIIILSSMIGIFIGLIFIDKILRVVVSVILFLLLAFSSGLFVPLKAGISSIFLFSPAYLSVINIQAIMSNEPSIIFPSMIVLIISVVIFFINLIISYKVLRS